MPAAAWPSGVPECVTLETFGSGVGNGLLRTETEMGPPKVRRRFTAVTRPLVGTVVMSYAQLATLETFIANTLAGGSLPFTISSQRGGADVLAMFAAEQGSDLLPWTKAGQGKVAVQLNLIILP
jgi:hypothetical protein